MKTVGVDFFCYHRDRLGSMALRDELLEQHWSYMDRYQVQMIARGPTLVSDTPTGSVHILSLPDPVAARAFAFDEPNYQAGVYRDVLLRRWRNLLGRTMWDFPGGPDGGNRYLVLGFCAGQAADLAVPPVRDELIAYGPLLSDNGAAWLGTAVLLRAPDPDKARAILAPDRYASIEVHSWQFGGRRLCRPARQRTGRLPRETAVHDEAPRSGSAVGLSACRACTRTDDLGATAGSHRLAHIADERKSRSGSKDLIKPGPGRWPRETGCFLLLRRARHERPKGRRQCIHIGFILSIVYHLNPAT